MSMHCSMGFATWHELPRRSCRGISRRYSSICTCFKTARAVTYPRLTGRVTYFVASPDFTRSSTVRRPLLSAACIALRTSPALPTFLPATSTKEISPQHTALRKISLQCGFQPPIGSCRLSVLNFAFCSSFSAP